MTAINLLPHRETARRRRREHWRRHLLFSAMAGSVLAALMYFDLRADLADLHLKLEAARLEQMEAQRGAQALRQDQGELRALQTRRAALQAQQAMQGAPMAVIAEVVRAMPAGMALRELRVDGLTASSAMVLIEGHAVDAAAVTKFINALSASAQVMQSPELIEIASTQIDLAGARPRVEAFSVRARLAGVMP